MRRTRADRGDEQGFTLIEVSIAGLLISIVGGILATVLWAAQSQVIKQSDRSVSNDQARLAIYEIERTIRSGQIFEDPAAETTPYRSLRVFTQSDSDIDHDPSAATLFERCVQFKVTDAGLLQRRDYAPYWVTGGYVTTWRTLATGLVNSTTDASQRPFTLNTASNVAGGSLYDGRLLQLVLMVNSNAKNGESVRIDSSVAGRNFEYDFPDDVCDTLPPG